MLFLHNVRVNVENPINNKTFTNGFGVLAHSYFITRNYIKNIISKYGKLPEPTGRHWDSDMNFNIVDKNNCLYSEKIFYTNKICMHQYLNNDSDNNFNVEDNFNLNFDFDCL